jgi:hypothetical protein
MPQQVIQLLAGDKVDSQTDYRDAMPVNMSGILRPIFGSQGYMLQQPGLTQYATALGRDRGATWNDKFQEHFRLSLNTLITVSSTGTVTNLGTILNTDQASFANSFNTQAIVADGAYYLYDPTDGFRQVTDPNVGTPIDIVWVDGYYFMTDGAYLYHTTLADEEVIDPLAFATAEFSPDPTIGLSLTMDDKVIAWNRYSTEYFANAANEFFAFTRLASRTVKYGLVGTHCKAEIGGEFFFMGGPREGNVSIYKLEVGGATNIASREIDKLIGQYSETELAQCVLETRIVDNYPYLVVHLPNDTVMLNIKIAAAAGWDKAWCVLRSSIVTGDTYRGINAIFDPRRGQWVMGDKVSAKIGYLDMTVATHYDIIAEWELFTPLMYMEAASIDEMTIQTIPGFTVYDDAQVFVSTTYDGQFYSMESIMQYGAPSAFGQRFMAFQLGYVPDFVGIKLRGASRSRMAFASAKLTYG